ncbi:MAG TPA: hypothetical protein VEQ40_03795, partial [Pyrinomonadaceae bacterium]|nr:hypothetical protein [Pyrinomonadaceae bacterium]
PVVMLSASDDESRRVEAFAAGADDYIVKPSTPLELLTRVSAHLETAQRERDLLGSNRELSFLADLGRGLLSALEPDQVVRRVAGATYEGANAALCACVLKIDERGTVVCVFDREGSAEGASLIHMERLGEWLESADSLRSALMEETERFFVRDDAHVVEYAAPLHGDDN